jgi:hypothetical protein
VIREGVLLCDEMKERERMVRMHGSDREEGYF